MATSRILQPYVSRREPGRLTRVVLAVGFVMLGAFYGLMSTLLPAQLLAMPLSPILILGAVCLWMLPDVGEIDTTTMSSIAVWFIAIMPVWPSYVAINLPGLPWITPTRGLTGALLVMALVGISTSSDFRARIHDASGAMPYMRRIFWGFFATMIIAIPFSPLLFQTVNRWANNQIFWTMTFLLVGYFATYKGFVSRIARALVVALAITILIGLYEYRSQSVFWLPYLPAFLKADPEILARVAESQARAGTNIYRVRSTFPVSLYYAQYLALIFPFVIHYLVATPKVRDKLLLGLLAVATMVVMYLTNARSAMVGLLLTLIIYPFFWVWRTRKRDPQSIGASAGLFAYPAGMLVVTLIVLFWNRARVAVLGGGQHQASSDARGAQWDMGIPRIIQYPFGHGAATSGEVLGYTNRAGEVTVDTYYLTLLLDYGVFALPLFMLMFGLPLWHGFRAYMKSRDDETDLTAPLGIALFNFVVIAGVLSSEANQPIAFAILGCLGGLIWRQNNGMVRQPRLPPPKP
ncbi:O-antigen ligase family protein [Sandarakinorhabdus sp.]|uniref:O-antigen ligase family protein n=1 Tax=Sandarakinorhabdus sp. TaxID=1916663 RepID=UPI00286E8A15|nr:O-antigen ligase family protein [Sandarakinorhabdus sp.]